MTVVRVCLTIAALCVPVLLFISTQPSPSFFWGIAVIAGLVAVPALVTFVGAVARRVLAQATGLDITWPLLLLSLFVFGVFLSGMLTPLDPDGCYTVERADEVKSVHFKLWGTWSTLAFLGLGAAMMSKDEPLSRLAAFLLPLVLILFAAGFFSLAFGHPIVC